MRNKIYFVTTNIHKFNEAKILFENEDITIVHKQYEYPEIRSENLEDIVIEGINFIKNKYPKLKKFFVEDAGLFINSLNNFPGQFSKYVFYKIGCEGILKLLKGLDRNAYFKSVIGYYNKRIYIFDGICYGKLATESRGKKEFGYDPIFIPENCKHTFGEIDIREKNKYSHRGKAITKFLEHLKNEKICL